MPIRSIRFKARVVRTGSHQVEARRGTHLPASAPVEQDDRAGERPARLPGSRRERCVCSCGQAECGSRRSGTGASASCWRSSAWRHVLTSGRDLAARSRSRYPWPASSPPTPRCCCWTAHVGTRQRVDGQDRTAGAAPGRAWQDRVVDRAQHGLISQLSDGSCSCTRGRARAGQAHHTTRRQPRSISGVAQANALLEVDGLEAGYGKKTVLEGARCGCRKLKRSPCSVTTARASRPRSKRSWPARARGGEVRFGGRTGPTATPRKLLANRVVPQGRGVFPTSR